MDDVKLRKKGVTHRFKPGLIERIKRVSDKTGITGNRIVETGVAMYLDKLDDMYPDYCPECGSKVMNHVCQSAACKRRFL